jgi:hypothetical protein
MARRCRQGEFEPGKDYDMKLNKSGLLILPMAFTFGCATHHEVVVHDEADGKVLAPTSGSHAVRVYANPSRDAYETAPTASVVPAEEWNTAMGIRNLVAGDGYMKGACRHVDIEVIRTTVILRGRVVSQYDRHEIEARLAAVPGVTSIDDRLVIAGPP